MAKSIADKIKNADRIHRANTLILQAIEHESNPEIITGMIGASQVLSDVHKSCLSDLTAQ